MIKIQTSLLHQESSSQGQQQPNKQQNITHKITVNVPVYQEKSATLDNAQKLPKVISKFL